MKYPIEQFEKLKSALRVLKKYFDVDNHNPSSLNFMVYVQYADGQEHNKLIITNDNVLTRSAKLCKSTGALIWQEGVRIIEDDFTFELYPKGCVDTHIETAVKRALKEITNEKV